MRYEAQQRRSYQKIICALPRNIKGSDTKDSFHLTSISFRNRSETAASSFQQGWNLTAGYDTIIVLPFKTKANRTESMHFNKAMIPASFLFIEHNLLYDVGKTRLRRKKKIISAPYCQIMRIALGSSAAQSAAAITSDVSHCLGIAR